MENPVYIPPTVSTVEIEVECGFAASPAGAGIGTTPYDPSWN